MQLRGDRQTSCEPGPNREGFRFGVRQMSLDAGWTSDTIWGILERHPTYRGPSLWPGRVDTIQLELLGANCEISKTE